MTTNQIAYMQAEERARNNRELERQGRVGLEQKDRQLDQADYLNDLKGKEVDKAIEKIDAEVEVMKRNATSQEERNEIARREQNLKYSLSLASMGSPVAADFLAKALYGSDSGFGRTLDTVGAVHQQRMYDTWNGVFQNAVKGIFSWFKPK